MSERTLLWLLIAILVIIVVVKMCKNTNEGMRYKNNDSIPYPPSFKQATEYDNEDMRYKLVRKPMHPDSNYVSENLCTQPNDSNLPSGSYIETCGGCSSTNDNLSCYCLTIEQMCNPTSLNLDITCDSIQNCNGQLMCVSECPSQ